MMASMHIPRADPDRMSPLAQAYLAVSVAIAAAMAGACWLTADRFQSPSYASIKAVSPLWAWGILWAWSAGLSAVAALRQRETTARVSLIVSAGVTGMWAFGFVAALAEGRLQGPTGLIGWFGLVAKDLIVCVDPLRTPLEPVLRRFRSSPDRPN